MRVDHDSERQRFVAPDAPGAYLAYAPRDGGALDLQHTIVPGEHQDRGVATALVEAALRHARDNDLKIVPTCAFVRAYLEEHPEQRELVAS